MTYPDPQMTPTQPTPQTDSMSPARIVTLVLTIVGVIALLFTILGGIAQGLRVPFFSNSEPPGPVSTDGVVEVEIDSSASDFTLQFAPVDEAELTVTGQGAGDWQMTREGETLQVSPTRNTWWRWQGEGQGSAVALTLPESLQQSGISLDLSMAAGKFATEGAFTEVDAEVAAGTALFDLTDTREASFSLAAGSLSASLNGTPPTSVDVEVAAGAMNLSLPDTAYSLDQRIGAGTFSNGLRIDPASPNEIEVDLMAGSLTLTPIK
ncbi:MAG: hypothetical protein WAS54_06245 [Scrofimicrobium sp.]